MHDRRVFLQWAAGLLATACGSQAGDGGDGPNEAVRPAKGPDGSGVDPKPAAPPPLVEAEPTAPVALAEVGPSLPRRFPSSFSKFTAEDTELSLRVVSGRLPGDMEGHYFINGPIPTLDGSSHPFNGDGFVRRLSFAESSVSYKAAVVRTHCHYADRALAGNRDHAFQNRGIARFSAHPLGMYSVGVRNQANTSLQPIMEGRLLVTTDAGRPYEIDPVTLETVTPVGALDEWKNGLFTHTGLGDVPIPAGGLLGGLSASLVGKVFETMLFPAHFSSAHPCFDTHTGEFFTSNYNTVACDKDDPTQRFTHLLRWDGKGALERWNLLLPDGRNVKLLQSGHQMAISEDYILLMDSAVNLQIWPMILPNVPVHPQQPVSVVYILPRKELRAGGGDVTVAVAVIPGEAGHLACDYENPDGRLTVYVTHLIATDLAQWNQKGDVRFDNGAPLRADVVGLLPAGNDVNTVGRHVLDARTGAVLDSHVVADHDFMWTTLFHYHRGIMAPGRIPSLYFSSVGHWEEVMVKRIADLYANHPHRRVPLEKMPNKTGKPSNLFHLDARTMKVVDGYLFPPGRVMGSPVFIPKRGSTGWTDGYIVSGVLSDDGGHPDSTGDEFWVFDAKNLRQGPLCRLAHPELNLGFTIHSTWMPDIQKRRASYKVQASVEYAARLALAPKDVRDMFAAEVVPHFG